MTFFIPLDTVQTIIIETSSIMAFFFFFFAGPIIIRKIEHHISYFSNKELRVGDFVLLLYNWSLASLFFLKCFYSNAFGILLAGNCQFKWSIEQFTRYMMCPWHHRLPKGLDFDAVMMCSTHLTLLSWIKNRL